VRSGIVSEVSVNENSVVRPNVYDLPNLKCVSLGRLLTDVWLAPGSSVQSSFFRGLMSGVA